MVEEHAVHAVRRTAASGITPASASGPRRLVLLRHGRTAWNHEQRAQGHADVALDEVGHAQAVVTAPALAALGPVALWTSDLRRARETAAYVEDATGLTAVPDARLREYDLGARTGMTMPEFAEAFPDEYAAHRGGRYDTAPGAESTPVVVDRFTAAAGEVLTALAPGECGVVVAHGAALKVSLVAMLGWPVEAARTLRGLDNCGWAVIERDGTRGAVRLVAYNRTADFASLEAVG